METEGKTALAHQDFSPFFDLLIPTLQVKNQAYGNNSVSRETVLLRLGDKISRLQQVGPGDAREDTWLDVAGYAAIGWLMERGLWREGRERFYIACPIDAAQEQPEALSSLMAGLDRLGIEYYVPMMAWSNAKGSDVTKQVNELALKHSTRVIALWDTSKTPSVGTPFEIQMAKEASIPVWLVPRTSSAYLRPYVSKAFNGIEEVLDELRKERTIQGI